MNSIIYEGEWARLGVGGKESSLCGFMACLNNHLHKHMVYSIAKHACIVHM